MYVLYKCMQVLCKFIYFGLGSRCRLLQLVKCVEYVCVCVCVCGSLKRHSYVTYLLFISVNVYVYVVRDISTHAYVYFSLWLNIVIRVCVCVKAANDEREIIWYSLMLFERWRLEEATVAAMTSQLLSACINLDTYIHTHTWTHTRTRMNILSLHVQCTCTCRPNAHFHELHKK